MEEYSESLQHEIDEAVRQTAYTLFNLEKAHDKRAVAKILGMTVNNIDKFLSGYHAGAVMFALRLFYATKDVRFIEPLFDDTGFMVCQRAHGDPASDDVKTELLDVVMATGAVSESLKRDLADGILDQREIISLIKQSKNLEIQAREVTGVLESMLTA